MTTSGVVVIHFEDLDTFFLALNSATRIKKTNVQRRHLRAK